MNSKQIRKRRRIPYAPIGVEWLGEFFQQEQGSELEQYLHTLKNPEDARLEKCKRLILRFDFRRNSAMPEYPLSRGDLYLEIRGILGKGTSSETLRKVRKKILNLP